jgi:hypothetical protein
MPTRFYFPAEGSGTPSISPGFDAGWEQTGQATRLKLVPKSEVTVPSTLANNGTRTVPITTTQDILCNQFVSRAIPAQNFTAATTVSGVIRVFESATTANVFLAIVVRVVDETGVARGTLASTFNTGTEWALSAAAATRILAATALTPLQTFPGDRIVVEIGGHATAPTAATTYTMRQGYSATSDFALTAALTTDLNPWIEFSTDIFGTPMNNYQQMCAREANAGVMSISERIR